jgi:propanol-preferring alcohol dehydrogenase
MKAAVVHDFNQPLSIEDVPRPEPGDGQVLVRIEACGLCHTDIHAAHGDWPIKPPLPLIPGHEGVGIVEALGPGVGDEIGVGDRVAIPWLGFACGHCGTATLAVRRSARPRSTPATAWTAGTPSTSPPMRATS